MDYTLPDKISKEEHLAVLKNQEKMVIFNVLLGVTILVIIPLGLYAYSLHNRLSNESISCSKLSSNSIHYPEQGGEDIPSGCLIGR